MERSAHPVLRRIGSPANYLALLVSLAAVFAAHQVAVHVYERIAHIEDELAYVWQAQVIARGQITTPIPPGQESFLVPFVVDYNGHRFGKYPLGWPVVLAAGIWLEQAASLPAREWVNPLLAGLAVWLTYRLGRRVMGTAVGLLAAGLTLLSPFFLMNSGALLSHPLGLALSAAFALAWLGAFDGRDGRFSLSTRPLDGWLPAVAAGLSLGLLAVTRPLTAVGAGLPFAFHGLYLFLGSFRRPGGATTRLRLLAVGLIALAVASLQLLWQYAATSDPLLNPYTLWWEYDRVGFGPGVGHALQGNTLEQSWYNTRFSLWVGCYDLFGWGGWSWIFLPCGLWAIRRNLRAWLLVSVFPCLVIVYLAYWVGSWLYGPRYYYEGLYSLTLISAAGIAWLAGWPLEGGQPWPRRFGWRMARPLMVTTLVALLAAANVFFYLPLRMQTMTGLYGIRRSQLEPFQQAENQQFAPALMIVHPKRWTEYGVFLELENPFFDTPFIFIVTHGVQVDQAVTSRFPERAVYHYYPDTPTIFYTAPRPSP